MPVVTKRLKFETKGRDHMINVTDKVQKAVKDSKLKSGIVTVFIVGSTGSVTTIEYESGLIADIKTLGERIAPSDVSYVHDETWGDANGYSHLRSTVIGTSFTAPFVNGELTLGTWQQIVVIDHDNRPRSREVVIQIIGE